MKTFTLKAMVLGTLVAVFASGMAHADKPTRQMSGGIKQISAKADPKAPKPPKCGFGFQVVNPQLVTSHLSNFWVYECKRQDNMMMSCNDNLVIMNPKSETSTTQNGKKVNAKVTTSYQCYQMPG